MVASHIGRAVRDVLSHSYRRKKVVVDRSAADD